MQTFTILLFLCAFIATGLSAPTWGQRDRAAAVQDILSEIEEAKAATTGQEKRARIEQKTFQDLTKVALNSTLNYLKNRFLTPDASDQHVQEEMAEIEQETFKELAKYALNNTLTYLRKKFLEPTPTSQFLRPYAAEIEQTTMQNILSDINTYAENQLQPASSSELATVSQKNWKGFLRGTLDKVNNYAQHKLRSPDGGGLKQLFASLLDSTNNYAQNKLSPKEIEAARIEQENIRELLSGFIDSANNFAQSKLSPREKEQYTLKELAADLIDGANNYAQNKLTPSEAAKIEQETFEELLGSLINGTSNYVQSKLEPATELPSPSPMPSAAPYSSSRRFSSSRTRNSQTWNSETRNYQTSRYGMQSDDYLGGEPDFVGGSQGKEEEEEEEVDEQALTALLPLLEVVVPLITNLLSGDGNDSGGSFLDSLFSPRYK